MARKKRHSTTVAQAQLRAVSLRSINEELVLTAELTLAAYVAKINTVQAKLSTYNTKLSELDGLLNDLEAEEKELRGLSGRMLAAVAAVYGKDSTEYEQAGGTRQREIVYRPSKSPQKAS